MKKADGARGEDEVDEAEGDRSEDGESGRGGMLQEISIMSESITS